MDHRGQDTPTPKHGQAWGSHGLKRSLSLDNTEGNIQSPGDEQRSNDRWLHGGTIMQCERCGLCKHVVVATYETSSETESGTSDDEGS